MIFPYLLAMIDDAFQSLPATIVVPGAKMEFAMQLLMTPLVQDLVGESWKPTSPRPSPPQAGGEGGEAGERAEVRWV